MDAIDIKKYREECKEFIRRNLKAMANELFELHSTGILPKDGKVRELTATLHSTWGYAGATNMLSIAESMINDEALKFVSAMDDKDSTSLSGQIMNIQVDIKDMEKQVNLTLESITNKEHANDRRNALCSLFKQGHRQARHAASELSLIKE